VTLTTAHYRVVVPDEERQAATKQCASFRTYAALKGGVRVGRYPAGIPSLTREACCEACLGVGSCAAWEWRPSTGDCFLMEMGTGVVTASDRTLGWAHPETGPIEVRSADGTKLLWQAETLDAPVSLLDFPVPATLPAVFALRDAPRFVPPEWGATPMPDTYQGPCRETNGFDLRNDAPDAYFFLTNGKYKALRSEFLRLTGPVPVLPEYVFGTWFSWYHSYSESTAMEEVLRFRSHNISLDVFGLDVGWRDASREMEYVIDTKLFPDMKRFISWIHSQKLHTFFNDHPEAPPERKQMSPEEVNFRWNGLTSMLKLGLDFWWYDSNWMHEIIPGAYGLDNKVWVQAVYRWVTSRFRPAMLPHTLAMFTSTHPAHHRFPIWWTGDIHHTALLQNIGYTVDGGVQLKPYVHPDCGGHLGHNTDDVYTRWIQFCAMSNIIRIHCSINYVR
jgi:alpha-glucosidase (family GH31 glycosyl hydrolase)